jgi:phosphoribosylformylglycinamidine synthase
LNAFDAVSQGKIMAHRIEVGLQSAVKDAWGEKIKRRVWEDLHLRVDAVSGIDVYTLDMEATAEDLMLIAEGPLVDPVIQRYAVDAPLAQDFDWLIEVGFRPGVTDNVGRTAREAVELVLGRKVRADEKVYTSKQCLIKGSLSLQEVETIATGLLANELVQRFSIVHRRDWDPARGMPVIVPRVTGGSERGLVDEIDLTVDDEGLMRISQERVLALSFSEMKAIQAYAGDERVVARRAAVGLGRHLTDVELEALAQTWSEHCKHKIFSGIIHYRDEQGGLTTVKSLFNTYIRAATDRVRASLHEDWLLSVFEDNAGVIAFNHDYSLVYKVETHNTPSALDPYGGALTGIVGVNRDPFGTGKGAKLIFNTDVFCFATPFYSDPLPPRLLHPRRIYEGVREGVEHGGNKSGIPTVNGSLVFDDRYLGKPLVYCGTGGIMPREVRGEPSHVKRVFPGDLVVMTGGRIGKDGIHGATFSSEELHEGSPVTAVQIGDPITQKRMTDFLLQARDLGLYTCITDNGAGGLSSSVGEMALQAGGCELHLEKAPLKYSGLRPWEILLSEAQERMTIAVSPEKVDRLFTMAEKMGVEATVLGKFTDSGAFHILYDGKTVAYLDMEFLHKGVPPLVMDAQWEVRRHDEPDFEPPRDLKPSLLQMLGRLNICSKESVVRQYDHEVQGGSVVKPLVGAHNDGPSDAAVIRPVLDSSEGVVISHGICPRYGDIDTYHMAACAIDEALRNYCAVGGNLDRVAGLDNFCWCDPIKAERNPDGDYKLAQLVRACMALYDYTTAFGVPCISGKDSMKNDYRVGDIKISIPPTLLFSVMGKMDDVQKAVTMDVKQPGDAVYMVGETFDELGGSEYYALHGRIGNRVPMVDAVRARDRYRALSRAITSGLVASCHDCSDGGLGVALAESCFAGGLGAEVDLRKVPAQGITRNDSLFYSESASRFVVTVHPAKKAAFEEMMKGAVAGEMGVVRPDKTFTVTGLSGAIVIKADIDELKEAWQKTLRF